MSSSVVSLNPVAVTMMPPVSSVATDLTYLEVGVELSQPQFPAVGKLAALLV